MIGTGNIQIPVSDQIVLEGNLDIPIAASGIVLFAHGGGSSRLSPRNHFIAKQLREVGHATLLFDLLTQEERSMDERTSQLRFDIGRLTERLLAVANFVKNQKKTASLKIGYFGASTGSAAALSAAAQDSKMVRAIVSRGGRPDLAGGSLAKVKSPTLLIVGEWDDIVVDHNQRAKNLLTCESKLEIVPCATHHFEEAGALDKVATLAADWFSTYLF